MTSPDPFELPKNALKILSEISPDDQLHAAAVEFDNLQKRTSHPSGKMDNAGRFFLSKKYACCHGIREPSRAFPHPERLHGRTAIHVAHGLGIPDRASDIQRYRRLMDKHVELRSTPTIARAALNAAAARIAISELDSPLANDAQIRKLKRRTKAKSALP